MSAPPAPAVTIVIATYNWSSALACALESIRGQTFTDFEVLVVGDACTDDSADVVAGFADRRFRWHNLAENHGSQWGPNNFGLERAGGALIAYLGHDDIWHPTHLEACVRTLRQTEADLVGGICIHFGPPGSGMLGVTGLLVADRYTPNQFMVPSSIVHQRALAERIGGWRQADAIDIPTDADFLARAHAAGARLVSTNELTVFKFNAAFRRGAYTRKDASEQRALLQRIHAEPDLQFTLTREALRSAIEGRLMQTRILPPGQGQESPQRLAAKRRFKGAPSAVPVPEPIAVADAVRFGVEDRVAPLEWHGIERHAMLGEFRWSGPHVRSSIELPVLVDRDLTASATVVAAIAPEVLDGLVVEVDGAPVPVVREPCGEGYMLTFPLAPISSNPKRGVLVTFVVPHVLRPVDLWNSDDHRWLGIAVGGVEVCPADRSPPLAGSDAPDNGTS